MSKWFPLTEAGHLRLELKYTKQCSSVRFWINASSLQYFGVTTRKKKHKKYNREPSQNACVGTTTNNTIPTTYLFATVMWYSIQWNRSVCQKSNLFRLNAVKRTAAKQKPNFYRQSCWNFRTCFEWLMRLLAKTKKCSDPITKNTLFFLLVK